MQIQIADLTLSNLTPERTPRGYTWGGAEETQVYKTNMSIGVNRKNLEKLKKFVHAQPNIKPDRKRGERSPTSEAVRSRGRLGNQPEGT